MTPHSVASRLLVVGEQENILHAVCRVMQPGGWVVHTALNGEEGLELFRQVEPQVVISAYPMPDMEGMEFLLKIRAMDPKVQCIVLAALGEQSVKSAVSKGLVFRFIFKPWNETQFFLTVQSAFKQYALEKENEHLFGLTHQQNADLRAFNLMLEQKVLERTQQLSVAKREWESTFDSIETPLALVDTDSLRLRRINRAYARQAQRAVGEVSERQRCFAFLFGRELPCLNCPLPQKQSLGLGQTLQAEIRHNDRIINLYLYSMDEGKVAICSYRDISEERAMYKRLAEAEKMVAVGHLAGGVAHEINNPLSGILAFVQLMKRERGRSQNDLELFGLIEESALRCKRIVESLLQLSRKPQLEDKRLVDFGRCVEDAVVLFRAQVIDLPKVKVRSACEANLPKVYGDFGQIGQVVLSLLQNGLHSLKDNVGVLDVKVGLKEDQCFFSISDNGEGISEKHLPHIFEPHFTTKPVGKGTGLGLSIAYRIVNDHGGKFEVKSEVGIGTTFWVFFPAQLQRGDER
ncbi:MAG: ATP-binding protein [Cystobacterineae bacterium]|nr:ATP-binding protein [Cystobacterineae bacterium]